MRIRVHDKSTNRLKNKLRILTNRNKSISMEVRIKKINYLLKGWVNYYKLADMKTLLVKIDEWVRRRLRACIWKEWKKVSTKYKNLRRFGIDKQKAWEYANSRKGYWRISKSPILNKTLTKAYWRSLGYAEFSTYYLSRL